MILPGMLHKAIPANVLNSQQTFTSWTLTTSLLDNKLHQSRPGWLHMYRIIY